MEGIAEDAVEEGTPEKIPAPLHERPDLEDFQASLYDAWRLLSPGRPIAMGATACQPLPLHTGDILAVAAASGFEPLPFLRLCRELDGVYLASLKK